METDDPFHKAEPVGQVTVFLFHVRSGYGHWAKVSGQMHPALLVRLAVLALIQRLTKQIW
jgi:hypothetical protein